jgi:hypothetical protein
MIYITQGPSEKRKSPELVMQRFSKIGHPSFPRKGRENHARYMEPQARFLPSLGSPGESHPR